MSDIEPIYTKVAFSQPCERRPNRIFDVMIFDRWLAVDHDGTITWNELQDIKNHVWGRSSAAIEIYPPDDLVVDHTMTRHLWRLGENEFFPDLSMEGFIMSPAAMEDTLEHWFSYHWGEGK